MKKITGLLIIVAVLSMLPSNNSYAYVTYDEFECLEPTAEDVFAYISTNIIDKSMDYRGENDNWKASLVLNETVTESGQAEYNVNLTLTPKTSSITWTKFSMISHKGYYAQDEWQIFQDPISITSGYPLPILDEEIVIVASQNNFKNSNILFLRNNDPIDMISSDRAIRIFIDKFYETFGFYPLESYSYEINVYQGDWLMSYDDNDDIGGKAVLLIDGITGEVDEIKIDE